MIHALTPYPAMKDSGVPWLGQVPEHWDVTPALAVYKPREIKNKGMIEKTVLSLSYGRIVIKPEEKLRGLVPESFETYQIVEPGNIIVRTTDLQNDKNSLRIGHARDRGIITSAYMCLETTDRVLNEFGYQYLNAYDLLKIIYGYGSGLRQNLDFKDIRRMPVLVPPPDEQAAIVRYLAHADRRIRRTIAAKQKLIKLLQEQKQVIIHQAVTRGLDSDVKLKPSGVEWLGDVPEGWDVIRSKRLFISSKELAQPGDVQLSATQAYGVIPQEEYEARIGRRVVKIFMHLEKRKHVERNDFVMSMRSFQGGLERAWATGAIRSSYVVLRPTSEVDVKFFSYLLKSPGYIRALQSTANFIRDGQDLTEANFREVDLPLIPLDEQRAIAAHIATATASTEQAASRLEREISFLREYRIRLIADVVTGKLDVRDAAAQLPELEAGALPDEAEMDVDELDAEEGADVEVEA